MRIIYGSPPTNEPSGGVKVIYRHAELLRNLGIDAYVWLPGDQDFICDWFDHRAAVIRTGDLSPGTDFLIVPEIWATGYVRVLKSMGFRVGIFVQNAYLTHVNLDPGNSNGIRDAYFSADLVFSISTDTSRYLSEILLVPASKLIELRYSVDRTLFYPAMKLPLITYMPRKMGEHSGRVVSIISGLLPSNWEIRALDRLSERAVASALSRSILFLAFSEFEGLPVPPVEAALAGNIVIGYHGQGGREYWTSPNFVEIQQGDIQRFVFEVLDKVVEVSSGQLNLGELNSGINFLAASFSVERERSMLMRMVEAISALTK